MLFPFTTSKKMEFDIWFANLYMCMLIFIYSPYLQIYILKNK